MAEENSESATGGNQFNEATELAQALQELQKGEKTATELEKKLDAMEARIEALLAGAELDQQTVEQIKKETDDATESEKKE